MKPHLNLLPVALQRRQILRRQSRRWSLRGALLATIAFVLLNGAFYRLHNARNELELWQRRAAGVQAISESNQELVRKIGAIQRRLEKYHDAKSDQLGYQLLATVSHSAKGVSGTMQIQKMSLTEFVNEPAPKADGKTKPEPAQERISYRLSLVGVALHNLQVAQFTSALRDSGAFERVDLKSSRSGKDPHDGVRTYQIDCTF